MNKNKNNLLLIKESLLQAKKVGNPTFNGRKWAITILNCKGEINNFTFNQDDYWQVKQLIQNYEKQRR